MQRGNVKIMAVTAVIIMVCLLFSYFYTQTGDGGNTDDKMPVGYVQVFDVTEYGSDGSVIATFTTTQTSVGYDGDTFYYLEHRSDTGESELVESSVSAQGARDPMIYEAGATVETQVYGTLVGDWYVSEGEGLTMYTFVTEGGVVVTYYVYPDGTYDRYENLYHAMNDVREEPSTVDTDFQPGDHMTFLFEYSDGSQRSVTMTVTAVDGDQITYVNSETGDTNTCSASEFLCGGEPDMPEGTGTYLIGTAYGYKLCSMAAVTDERYSQYLFLGQDDGVCYAAIFVNGDGSYYGGKLVGSSNIQSEYYDENIDGVGTTSTYDVVIYDDATGEQVMSYTSVERIISVYGDTHSIETTIDGIAMPVNTNYMEFDWRIPDNLYATGVGFDSPVHGAVTVDLYRWYSTDGVLEYAYVLNGEAIRWIYDYGDYTYVYDVVSDEPGVFDSCTVDTDMAVGDYLQFEMADDQGNTFTVRMTVTAVDGDTITYVNTHTGMTYTCTAEQFLSGGEIGSIQGDGRYVIDTPYGERLCSMKTVSDERYTQFLYVGVDDGVCYFAEFVNDDTYYAGFIEESSVVDSDNPLYKYVGTQDRILITEYDADGNVVYTYEYRYRAVAAEGDRILIAYELSTGESGTEWVSGDNYENFLDGMALVQEDYAYESESLGSIVCDLYEQTMEDGTVRYTLSEGYMSYVWLYVYTDGSRTLFETVETNYTADSLPQFEGSTVDTELETGDYLEYENTITGDLTRYTVVSVDGDTVTYENGDRQGTCTVQEFLSGGKPGYSLGTDATLITTAYGERVCSVITYVNGDMGAVMLVGEDDGVLYAIMTVNGDSTQTFVLVDSSIVS